MNEVWINHGTWYEQELIKDLPIVKPKRDRKVKSEDEYSKKKARRKITKKSRRTKRR